MRVYDLPTTDGVLRAFEIDVWLGRRFATRIVSRIRGVCVLRRPKILSWFREEVFCEFELQGQRFEIWEPYGDNSRYWIGPDSENSSILLLVRQAFIDYKNPWLFR